MGGRVAGLQGGCRVAALGRLGGGAGAADTVWYHIAPLTSALLCYTGAGAYDGADGWNKLAAVLNEREVRCLGSFYSRYCFSLGLCCGCFASMAAAVEHLLSQLAASTAAPFRLPPFQARARFCCQPCGRLYYLALPPSVYPQVCAGLKVGGAARWSCVLACIHSYPDNGVRIPRLSPHLRIRILPPARSLLLPSLLFSAR